MSVSIKKHTHIYKKLIFVFSILIFVVLGYTPTQQGNYHHATFRNPTAAVNLLLVGKQYPTLLQAEAAGTRNLIGWKIISNVKRSDARNSFPTVVFVKVDWIG